jgi:hypothetical protein
MAATRRWSVDIFIDEHEDERITHAEAPAADERRDALVGLTATGARRTPRSRRAGGGPICRTCRTS